MRPTLLAVHHVRVIMHVDVRAASHLHILNEQQQRRLICALIQRSRLCVSGGSCPHGRARACTSMASKGLWVSGHMTPSPDGVQNVAVLEYPQQLVVRRDLVEVGSLLVGKEQVRLPDGVQHRRVQVQGVIWVLGVGESGVVPLLTKEDVDAVVLQTHRNQKLKS